MLGTLLRWRMQAFYLLLYAITDPRGVRAQDTSIDDAVSAPSTTQKRANKLYVRRADEMWQTLSESCEPIRDGYNMVLVRTGVAVEYVREHRRCEHYPQVRHGDDVGFVFDGVLVDHPLTAADKEQPLDPRVMKNDGAWLTVVRGAQMRVEVPAGALVSVVGPDDVSEGWFEVRLSSGPVVRVPGEELGKPGTLNAQTFADQVARAKKRNPRAFVDMVPANQMTVRFSDYRGKIVDVTPYFGTSDTLSKLKVGFVETVVDEQMGMFRIVYPFALPKGESDFGNFIVLARVDKVFNGINALGQHVSIPEMVVIAAYDGRGVRTNAEGEKLLGKTR